MNYEWNSKSPVEGDRIIRLPGHEDTKEMKTGDIYTVNKCSSGGAVYLKECKECYDIRYFAPAPVETSKSEIYEIY